jgi:hypothetical protein
MAGLGKIAGNVNPQLHKFCVKARYDVTNSVHSGVAATAIGLGVVIPNGAVVTSVIGSAVTALASLGAPTVAINIGTPGGAGFEAKAATAYNDAAFSGVDEHYNTPVAITDDSEVNIDVENAANLTGGVYDIYVTYLL